MSNVLTSLAADIYKARDIVGRELVGLVSSVIVNGGTEAVAKGDTVRSSFTRPQTVNTTFAPSMTIPEGTDQTVDNKTMTLNKYASVQIPWTGEDIKHVDNGIGYETVYGDQIAQAFRTCANKMELDLWAEVRANATRAWGTAGTTPFASSFNELPQVRKILVDNGMPFDGNVSLVMDTFAGANLRSLAQLQKINESGDPSLLRQGAISELMGFLLKESAQVGLVTKGTGTSYTTNTAGYAVGATAITLITGSGTINAGDVVTFAGDSNKYVVAAGGGIAAPGAITLAAPGLRQALPASAQAVTVGNNFTANVALHRNAAELAMRPPAQPKGGDAAVDNMIVQDPHSGLVFEIAVYKGYQKMMLDVRTLYDVKAWKPEAISLLLG
jgi:hypothetical protein